MKPRLIAVILAIASLAMNLHSAETKISFVYSDKVWTRWFNELKDQYEKKYPDRKVQLILLAGTVEDNETKSKIMLRDAANPVDLVLGDTFALKADAAGHIVAPLPELKDWSEWSNYSDKLRELVTVDGVYYGISLGTGVTGLYYNKNIFRKAGISIPWNPKTWDDVIKAAQQIRKSDPKVIPFWAYVGNIQGETTTMNTLDVLIFGAGGELFKNGKWVVTSQALLEAFTFIHTIFKNKLGPQLSVILNPQAGSKLLYEYAPEQKVAIMLDGHNLPCFWKDKYAAARDYYDYVPMPTIDGRAPGFVSLSGGLLLGVNYLSKHKAESIDFIKIAGTKENMLNLSKYIMAISPRKDVPQMEGYPDILKVPTSFLPFTRFRPAEEAYPLVSGELRSASELVALGQKTPEEAMNMFAENVERALGKDMVVREYTVKNQ